MRWLILVLALSAVAAQSTELPEGDICLNHTPRSKDIHQHECHCDYKCHIDANGEQIQDENPACKAYCRKSACSCWPEAPCPKPS